MSRLVQRFATLRPRCMTCCTPNGDWTLSDPEQSRVRTASVAANAYANYSLTARVLRLGPDLGNPVYYPWYANVLASSGLDLNVLADRQRFVAQALKEGLEFLVTGANAGTGLVDPLTGRANLHLVQDNGIPLHPGWGRDQRTLQPGVPPYATFLLFDNVVLKEGFPTANREGQLFYAQRNKCHKLVHHQSVSQVGFSSLITVNELDNGDVIRTVQPRAFDQSFFFEGNYRTEDIALSVDAKKKK